MALAIENTHSWSQERMAAVWPSVLACIRKFVARFPDEMTEDDIVANVMCGKRQLWVVYEEDEPDTAVLAGLTERITNVATGVEFVNMLGVGGTRMREAVPLLDAIEAWAVDNGAELALVTSRLGCSRMLQSIGYERRAVVFAKRLGNEADAVQ